MTRERVPEWQRLSERQREAVLILGDGRAGPLLTLSLRALQARLLAERDCSVSSPVGWRLTDDGWECYRALKTGGVS